MNLQLFIPKQTGIVTLDDCVSQEHPFEGAKVDFVGDDLNSAVFARMRISAMYRNRSNMYGYLELSREKYKAESLIQAPSNVKPTSLCKELAVKTAEPEKIILFNIHGIIEVPQSLLEELKRISEQTYKAFVHDFEIHSNSPDNINIAPFSGITLPEQTYFYCCHPKTHHMSFDEDQFLKDNQTDILILTGYLSKMDQWVDHARDRKFGKLKLVYEGLAKEVGARRFLYIGEDIGR